jgi:hypothetical protein
LQHNLTTIQTCLQNFFETFKQPTKKENFKTYLQQLYNIAQKPVRHIIGLMSGTSLDGLDVALCALRGAGPNTQVELLQFSTVPYDAALKAEIRQVFAKREIDYAWS